MAGRGVDIVLGGQPFDQKMYEQVVKAGGLHVIGTERHESRRIDNQLRGRSGRQGDPGSTQFYISMEDDLMRVFGSDRMKSIMQTLKVPEDMPIENRLISRSIEAAQKKIEGHNFDIRKHLVQYDDVINKHREVIYAKRREILKSGEADIKNNVTRDEAALRKLILGTIADEIEQVISFHTNAERREEWNIKEIIETVKTIFPLPEARVAELQQLVKGEGGKKGDAEIKTGLIEKVVGWSESAYRELEEKILQGP
jgi:preprotein translocase subunit SecA